MEYGGAEAEKESERRLATSSAQEASETFVEKMAAPIVRRLKRFFRLRSLNFAASQVVIILFLLLLAKRSHDRNYQPPEDVGPRDIAEIHNTDVDIPPPPGLSLDLPQPPDGVQEVAFAEPPETVPQNAPPPADVVAYEQPVDALAPPQDSPAASQDATNEIPYPNIDSVAAEAPVGDNSVAETPVDVAAAPADVATYDNAYQSDDGNAADNPAYVAAAPADVATGDNVYQTADGAVVAQAPVDVPLNSDAVYQNVDGGFAAPVDVPVGDAAGVQSDGGYAAQAPVVEEWPVTYEESGHEAIPRPKGFVELDPTRFSLGVTEEMLNNFQVQLPPLLENYKNPCWVEEIPEDFSYDDTFFNSCLYVLHTNKSKHSYQYEAFMNVLKNRTAVGDRTRIRCFPYFFLIGVGKCGTTDIYDTLKKYFGEIGPVFLKEPHYWEWKRCIDKHLCHGSHRTPTFAEYLDTFDSSADYVRERKTVQPDGTEYHDGILGDFTPSTMAFHPCWEHMTGNVGKDEPRFINAHYIKAIRPQTKFIAVMRDPVERIFSNFRMRDRMSVEEKNSDAENFHKEMVEIITYLNTCMQTKSVRGCAFALQKFDYGTHVTNSMYEVYIRDWLRIFPRDQFLFLRMEDYMVDRVTTFRKIVDFLGLEPMSPGAELMVGAKSAINVAPPADMWNETRTMLQDFFRTHNRNLANLLGDESWTWGY